jgi:crotonobetainyl-CoA:carnitine CoA-transferase CaiB-like acyl-CoA transferase
MPEWIESLRAAGVHCSPVRSFAEVVDDPQTSLRNMFPTLDCPTVGPHRVTGPAVKLSETPGNVGAPAPELGEHTAMVLTELLGLNSGEIDGLVNVGVIVAPGRRPPI